MSAKGLRTGFLLALIVLVQTMGTGWSRDASDLYETQAIVTGTGEVNRQPGFEECFRDVLVKVSGDQRVLKEPQVAAALLDAGSFVAAFRYRDRLEGIPIHDEQGTHDRPHDLFCTFDRDKVDAFLAKVGRRPWLEERPRIILFLSVEQAGHRFLLTQDGGDSPYMRDSLLAAAEPLAMQVDVPEKQRLKAAGIDFSTLALASDQAVGEATKESGGDIALSGSLVWSDAELGWIADWRLTSAGTAYTWQLRGISFDEAFRNSCRSNLGSRAPVAQLNR